MPTPQTKFVTAINARVRQFHWAANVFGSFSEGSLTADEHDAVAKVIQELDTPRFCMKSPRKIPLAFWKMILIPNSSCRLLKRHSDSKALACFLIPTTADFVRWHNIATAGASRLDIDDCVVSCCLTKPERTLTSFGSVHIDTVCDVVHARENIERLAIWFGVKRHNPSLIGSDISLAVRSLFQIPVI